MSTKIRILSTILLVCISLTVNPGCVKKTWRMIMSNDKISDQLEFNFKIVGTPVIWKDSKGYASLAFIKGYNVNDDRFIQPDAYWLNGKRVTDSFPLKYGDKYFVTSPKSATESFTEKYKGRYFITYPNQLAACDVNKDGVEELVAIDDGTFLQCVDHSGKSLSGYPILIGEPSGSIPNWPLTIRDFNNDGELELLYLAADHSLELRKLDGTSLPNFPVKLTGDVFDHHPVITSGNIFILYSSGEGIDGINISSGQRINGYPKSLEAYGNKSPYQRMCAFDSMDGIITSAEMPYLGYLNYKTGEQKKIEIKGASRITGLATMKVKGLSGECEYLLAYDEDNKKLFKIDNKGELKNSYDIKLDKKFRNMHLSTQYDAEKNENYIFLVSYIAPMVDIDDIFREYGTPEEENRIKKMLRDNLVKLYKTENLTKDHLKNYEDDIRAVKKGYLRKTLGYDKLNKLEYPPPLIDTMILKDTSDKQEIVFEEKIHNYEFETIMPGRGGQSTTIMPLFYCYNNKRYILVAMNLIDKVSDGNDKSIIRIISY
jgi:hypothetical protein